ncbi:MAG: hypothetical protein FJ253_09165 [Phycisphaerae bacterium]|nr:hypothetical protein [Phycisphaerae bacterium]
MQCNIDARGKAVRLVIGVITLLAGLALCGWWWSGGAEARQWPLWTSLGAIAGGLFAIYEGASGWCALRALGMRTPF